MGAGGWSGVAVSGEELGEAGSEHQLQCHPERAQTGSVGLLHTSMAAQLLKLLKDLTHRLGKRYCPEPPLLLPHPTQSPQTSQPGKDECQAL